MTDIYERFTQWKYIRLTRWHNAQSYQREKYRGQKFHVQTSPDWTETKYGISAVSELYTYTFCVLLWRLKNSVRAEVYSLTLFAHAWLGSHERKYLVPGSLLPTHSIASYRQNRGGRKGGPKTAKPHRNTPKNRKPHRIFSRIPKPHVHGGHNMKADVSKTCDCTTLLYSIYYSRSVERTIVKTYSSSVPSSCPY